MKKILYFLGALLLLQSCKKNEVVNPDHVEANVRINGNAYFITDASILRSTVPIFGNEYINIAGWNSLSSRLRITLPPNPHVGTFNIASGDYMASYYDGTNQTIYNSMDGSGTITIESITSSYIKGTFQFNCFNGSQVAEITRGSFEGDL